MSLPIRNSRIRLSQGQIFWREVGQGTALVFLHGSWDDGDQWLPVIEQLRSKYHCIAPDLLGFGESKAPDLHYSVELQVECLAEYLETLRLRQVYLIGHSVGGWIAASYALQHRDQVQGLVLMGAEGVALKGQRWLWVRWLTARPSVLTGLLRSLLPLARVLKKSQGIEQLLQRRQMWLRSPAACQLLFKRRRAEIQAEQLQDRLHHLKLPVLLLQSDRDTPTRARLNQIYAESPRAELRMVDSGEPDIIHTQPEQVAELIREFVSTSSLLDLTPEPLEEPESDLPEPGLPEPDLPESDFFSAP